VIRLSGSISVVVLFVLGVIISLGCGSDDKVTNSQNHRPVILALWADPDTFYEDHSTIITVIAEDPDSDALNYNWETRGPGLLALPGKANTLELTNCCPVVGPITAVVLSIVDDGRGGEARDSIRVWILPG